MSASNGDRSRFHRLRKKKINRRAASRAARKLAQKGQTETRGRSN